VPAATYLITAQHIALHLIVIGANLLAIMAINVQRLEVTLVMEMVVGLVLTTTTNEDLVTDVEILHTFPGPAGGEVLATTVE
jgi:hypothetical protein